jgi:ATP-dependent RNA helicase DDX56/DBP9
MSEGKGGVQAFDRISTTAVESLRYRAEDVAKSITKSVIREARAKDLRAELLNSKRLASFFEERPADLQLLRHDRSVASTAGAAAPHLKHIPSYLRDPSLQGKSFIGSSDLSNNGFLPFKKRRKTERADPIKGFAKAPNKGSDHLYVNALQIRVMWISLTIFSLMQRRTYRNGIEGRSSSQEREKTA